MSILTKPARKVLNTRHAKRAFEIVSKFYDNQPVYPDIRKEDMPNAPLFHVGSVMPMPESDLDALIKLADMASKPNMRIVEVGSWTGASTRALSVASRTYNGSIYAVDHWQGSIGVKEYSIVKEYDIFSIFRNNMRLLGCDNVYPMVMPSEKAVDIFPDESLDMVFIDADHRYEQVKSDIEMWSKKVKVSGIISGHDCEKHFTQLTTQQRKIAQDRLQSDYVPEVGHPGVMKALFDIYSDKYTIIPDSCVWYKVKEA